MKRFTMTAVMMAVLCGTAMATLAPWPVQKEYYGVLAHWRMNDNQVAGAVAQYKLDDNAASTTVVDSQGNGNGTWGHGNTNAHDVAAWCSNFGTALEFDGTNDHIDTARTFQSTLRDSFSISMWIQPHDGHPTAIQALVNESYNSNVVGVNIETDGKLSICYNADDVGGTYYTVEPVFSDGEQNWHNLVVVFDAAGDLQAFRDGVCVPLSVDADLTYIDFSTFTNTSRNLYIGCMYDGTNYSYKFDGRMDNVAIYPRALTAQDVAWIASCGTQSTESGITTVEGSDPDGKALTSQTSLSNIAAESGQIGRSFAFDGSSDYLYRADDSDLDFGTESDFSVSFWMKRGPTDASQRILYKKATSGGAGWLISTNSTNGRVVLYRSDGTNYQYTYSTGVDAQDGAWRHIVVVRDAGSTGKIYIDGVDRTDSSGNNAESYDLANSYELHIGCTNGHDQNQSCFHGITSNFAYCTTIRRAGQAKIRKAA